MNNCPRCHNATLHGKPYDVIRDSECDHRTGRGADIEIIERLIGQIQTLCWSLDMVRGKHGRGNRMKTDAAREAVKEARVYADGKDADALAAGLHEKFTSKLMEWMF